MSDVVVVKPTGAVLLTALRPRQWTKNALLFAGLIFAGRLGDQDAWLNAFAAFAAYCAVSSAAYLVNDVHDVAHDRLHPTKRLRPIASGHLGRDAALVLAAVLVCVGLALAALLGFASVVFLVAFASLQIAYTLRLKYVQFVDVLAIAGFFVLRAAAGAAAVNVRISPWLLLCTALLATFLGLAKRRGELVLVDAARAPGRTVLSYYSRAVVDPLLVASAAAAMGAYVLYCLTGRDSTDMVVTVPFVAFGVLRYLRLVRRDDVGEEPEEVLLTDVPILLAVAGWALTAATVMSFS